MRLRPNSSCCISVDINIFHPFKSLLVLVLVEHHLCHMNLQNKILWFFENQQNWFLSSFIPSSKSDILNMIFQTNYNQIMEIAPSCSACHSKLVAKLLSIKLLIWDLKLNFQRTPCKLNFKMLIFFLINPTVRMWSTHWDFQLSTIYIHSIFMIHQTFHDTSLKSLMNWDVKGLKKLNTRGVLGNLKYWLKRKVFQ